jgi:hypothetical protein
LIHHPDQRAKVIDIQSHKWMLKVYPQGKKPNSLEINLHFSVRLDGTESDHQLLKRMAYVFFLIVLI